MSTLREQLERLAAARKKLQKDDIRGSAYKSSQFWADLFALLDAVDETVALAADGQDGATVNDLKARLKEARSEFAIQARACGNWREWPEKMTSTGIPDWTHDDWKAATRAVMERDELRAAAPSLHKEGIYERVLVASADTCAGNLRFVGTRVPLACVTDALLEGESRR